MNKNKTTLIFSILLIFFLFGCIYTKQEHRINQFVQEQSDTNSQLNISINQSKHFVPLNCSDGTLNGYCSGYKPYFCLNGSFVYNATKCGCYPYQILENDSCRNGNECIDGTKHNSCSMKKPFLCYDGNLSENSDACGCDLKEIKIRNKCRLKNDCKDGTLDENCSSTKPFYCFNGSLVSNATKCGCLIGYKQKDENCINPYGFDVYKEYVWSYSSKNYNVVLGFNKSLVALYASIPRTYLCYKPCPTNWQEDFYKKMIFDDRQQLIIDMLVNSVDEINSDKKLKILITLVQSIPYDYAALYSKSENKYPYETLYLGKGVCGEKSLLAAAIISKLGYGVVLFSYEKENHMAIGIKCSKNISNYNSGYCFIETTSNCSRITDNTGTYVNNIKLKSEPNIYYITDGKELDYDTVMTDINAKKDFENAAQKIAEIKEILNSGISANKYNSYVKEYNEYVEIYNSYNKC